MDKNGFEFWYEVVTVDHDDHETLYDYGEDLDGARTDFMYFTQEEGTQFGRVVLRLVTTNYIDTEDVDVLDDWSNPDYE